MNRIDDLLLMAYVDGEVDGETAAEVERALELDTGLAARARAFREVGGLVRAAEAESLHEPVPQRLIDAIQGADKVVPLRPVASGAARARSQRSWVGLALAASVAALAVGLGVGYWGATYKDELSIAEAGSDNWLDQVAAFYNLYDRTLAKEERLLVDFHAEDLPELERWFASRMERELVVPDFSAQGYTAQGGRLIIVHGRPAAQLVYYADPGKLIGLVIGTTSATDTEPKLQSRENVNVLHWRQNGFAYAVVGHDDPKFLKELAALVMAKAART